MEEKKFKFDDEKLYNLFYSDLNQDMKSICEKMSKEGNLFATSLLEYKKFDESKSFEHLQSYILNLNNSENDVWAQNVLARMYLEGEGVDQDIHKVNFNFA